MIEKYVVSLELAKKLKEAGWEKETVYWWWERRSSSGKLITQEARYKDDPPIFLDGNTVEIIAPAPLAEEMLEELPKKITKHSLTYWLTMDYDDAYIMTYSDCDWFAIVQSMDKKLSNALARLWLWLKENGYLEENNEAGKNL